tara:strand:+ start:377 stop:787 length:411 start_codon:yes stop_codon:yes gene_type:complete
MGYFLKSKTAGISTASGTTAERPSVAEKGTFRFNEDTTRMEYYDGSAFRSMSPQGTVGMSLDTSTGDGSATTFTNFFTTAPADENNVIVVVGNVPQEPDQAYTVSGRDITFTSAPPNLHRIYAFIGFDSTTTSVLS